MDADLIARLLVQWATLTAGTMTLAEWVPLPVGTTSPEPNKGTRKRWSALAYSMALSFGAWWGGLVKVPQQPHVSREAAAVAVLALLSVATAHLIVRAKKQVRP